MIELLPRNADAAAGSHVIVTRHALGWLAFANGVGVLLALLLVVPAWNRDLAPFTYGRWIPVHLNAQLYGWCALPLVGLLFRALLPPAGAERSAAAGTLLWTGALAFGCVSWLAGWNASKPFVEWAGPARLVFSGALLALAAVVAAGYRRRAAQDAPPARLGKWLMVVALFLVPGSLYFAAGTSVYPAVNPQSGGATGTSLLGSTLGLVAIYLATPRLAGLPAAADARPDRIVWALFVLHEIAFAALGHGNRSNHEPAQIAGLASLAIWVPLLRWHLRRFDWPRESRVWLGAMLAWGALLTVSAWIMFLPGVLERLKFTHAFIAHSHLAMAGLLTSFNMVLLIALAPAGRIRDALGDRRLALLWQVALLGHLAALAGLATLEVKTPMVLFLPGPAPGRWMFARLAAGAVLFAVSLLWWQRARPNPSPTEVAG